MRKEIEVLVCTNRMDAGYALTVGKEYEVLKTEGSYVYIVNDNDTYRSYPREWFDEEYIEEDVNANVDVKPYDRLEDLAMNELNQRVLHFTKLVDNFFHDGDNEKAGYFLLVVDRYLNEMKLRVITTAI